MQLASEMHCIQGLEHCQDSAFISDFSLCLCFLFIHPNFNSWGRDWLAQFEWGTHPWSNSHGQRKRGDMAHSSHESTVDTKVVSSGKESSIDCHGGSVPSQGQWDMWHSVCYSRMANVWTVWLLYKQQSHTKSSLRSHPDQELLVLLWLFPNWGWQRRKRSRILISSLSKYVHPLAGKSWLVINWNSIIWMLQNVYNPQINVQWNITWSQTGLWFYMYLGA